MKIELSEREQRHLDKTVENNPVRRFLMNKDNYNFEIGDVLVKMTHRYDSIIENKKWVNEPISSDNPMAQRYVFIFKDEYGIGYMKRLQVSTGNLGSDIYSLSDYDYKYVRFQVDPEYAERMFLDADFDIKTIHKASLEARKIVTKINRKSGIKFKSLKDGNDFFKDLKVGDTYYTSSDYTGKFTVQYMIKSIDVVSIDSLELTKHYSLHHYRMNSPKEAINADFTYKLTIVESGLRSRIRESWSFSQGDGFVFYKNAPAIEDKR